VAGVGDLLFVGDVLVAEDEHGVSVHAPLDRDDFFVAERLLQSTPATSPAKTGCSGQIDTDMSTDIPQIPRLLGMIFRLIEVRRNEIRSQPASVSKQIVGSPALGVHPKPATAIALAIKPIPGDREFETSSSATACYFSIIHDVVAGKIHTKAHPKNECRVCASAISATSAGKLVHSAAQSRKLDLNPRAVKSPRAIRRRSSTAHPARGLRLRCPDRLDRLHDKPDINSLHRQRTEHRIDIGA
jgi:hypothetical protein